jgi:hypothetical protein
MLIAKTPLVYTLLLYIFIFEVGVSGIVSFLAHAFNADKIARYIGWPAGNPFQYEVACANLSYGILGILCIWLRGSFWVATAIACSVFLLGAGIGHIRDIIKNKNFAPGNAGFPLYSDFIKPLVIWALLIIHTLK